jgi:hypothetical protein
MFNEVIYTELQEAESKTLVEKYNKEAIAAGFVRKGPSSSGFNNQGNSAKRFRGNDYSQQRPRFDNFRRGPPMSPGGGGFRSN